MKIQPKVLLTEVFGSPLGSWMSAPSGMDVHAQMLVFPGFRAPSPKFRAGISARMAPGCPKDFLIDVQFHIGTEYPRDRRDISTGQTGHVYGMAAVQKWGFPAEFLHWEKLQGLTSWAWLPKFCRTFEVLHNLSVKGCSLQP